MNAHKLYDRVSQCRSEDGLTLIELIISVVILTMITGAISVAFVTSINSSGATNARVHTSDDAQDIAAFLVRDAQAAGGIDPTNPVAGADQSLGVTVGNPMGGALFTDPTGCGSGVLVFRFAWRDWVTPTTNRLNIANYFYVTGPNQEQLVRTVCAGGSQPATLTLGNNITSLTPSCNPAARCPGVPDSVSLSITATNTTSVTPTTYAYDLQATVRPQDQSVPGGGTIVGFPTLLALGPCSSSTVTGSGGAQLVVNGPSVINGASSCLSTTGGASFAPIPPATITYDPTGFLDPFSTLPAPDKLNGQRFDESADCPATGGSNPPLASGHYTQGVYQLALPDFTSSTPVTFDPGTYFFCHGINMSGHANITANRVLFYFAQGALSIQSDNSSLTMSGLSSGPDEGFALWMPRSNNTTALTFQGHTTVSQTDGLIYVPNVDVTLTGHGGVQIGSIIARTIIFMGGSHTHVGPLSPATDTLTSSLNPTTIGTQVTYTATITGSGPTPTGSVTFADGGAPINACGAAGVVSLNAGGVATCVVTYGSSAGSPHSITAAYSGDAYYSATAGNTVSEGVTADTTPPALTTLVSKDTNADGKIDHIVATFDDNLAPCTAPCTTGWTLTSPPAGTMLQSVTISGKVATLNLTGTTAIDTLAASMKVTLAATSGITDSVGNHSSFSATNVADGMGPVAVSIASANCAVACTVGKADAGDTITVTYSEPILAASVPATSTVTLSTSSGNGKGVNLDISGVDAAAFQIGAKNAYLTGNGATSAVFGPAASAVSQPTTSTVQVKLGTWNAAGALSVGASNSVTLTPAASLTDAAGNPATGTLTTAIRFF